MDMGWAAVYEAATTRDCGGERGELLYRKLKMVGSAELQLKLLQRNQINSYFRKYMLASGLAVVNI